MTREAALKRLFKDTCTITVAEKTLERSTGLVHFRRRVLYENLPCKLSYRKGGASVESVPPAKAGTAAELSQRVKLFLSAEVEVPAGAEITVVRPGRTPETYHRSGEPGVFEHHQEIPLMLKRRWA